MHLVFRKDKTFICHQGCNSTSPRENYIQLEANKDYIKSHFELSDNDWEEMIHVILDEESEDDKESINKIKQGYLPILDDTNKLSKTFEKGPRVLAKEAKIAAKEDKKTRKEEIKRLVNDPTTDVTTKVDLLLEYNDLK